MGAEIEATGLVESSHPQDADDQAAWPAIGDHRTADAQDTDLPGAKPVVPDQSGAAAGPPDASQEAAPATGERLRLARELHDTIASAIAVIAIQAGVADHALERCQAEPGRAREALRTIRAASLQALAELQATVTTCAGGGYARPAARRGPVGCAGRHGWRRRGTGGASGRRRDPAAPTCRRSGRLPDRAGGADQRGPPRRAGHGHRPADLPPGRPHRAGGQRRGWGRRKAAVGGRQRPGRHGGAGRRRGWAAAGRATPRRRLPRARHHPLDGAA
jgi:Histidine kinase